MAFKIILFKEKVDKCIFKVISVNIKFFLLFYLVQVQFRILNLKFCKKVWIPADSDPDPYYCCLVTGTGTVPACLMGKAMLGLLF
jgi:hypothetical protein